MSRVKSLIAAHLRAVAADEKFFDETGNCIDQLGADDTRKEEVDAFRAFCEEPCADTADVQAKIAYVLNGTVGQRDKLQDCLVCTEDYGFPITDFLKSLHVPL